MSKKKLVADTLFLTLAIYIAQFLSIIRGFIVAKFLPPHLYGYFSGLTLIQFYSAQGHLGILHGMNRLISIKKGAGDEDDFHEIKNSAFNSIMFLAVLLSLGIISFSYWNQANYSQYFLWGIRVFGLTVILQQLEMVYHSVLRAEGRVNIISISRVILSASNIVLVIALIQSFGFYGVLEAYFLAYVVSSIFLIWKSKIQFKLTLDPSLVASLLRTGLPISIIFLVEVLLKSVDRIIIIRYLDTAQLGYYAIALTMCEAMSRIPDTIIYSYFPKIMENFGRHNDPQKLNDSYQFVSILLGLIVSFCTGTAFLLVDILITDLLPEYNQAINAARMLLFAVFFMSLSQLALSYLIAINRNKRIVLFQCVIIIVSAVLDLMFIWFGYGIFGIAMGTVIAYVLYAICMLTYTLSFFCANKTEIILNQLFLYFPIIFCVGIIFLVVTVFPGLSCGTGSILRDLKSIVIPYMFFIILFIPLIYIMIYKRRKQFACLYVSSKRTAK